MDDDRHEEELQSLQDSVGGLQDEARRRRQRLSELKRKVAVGPESGDPQEEPGSSDQEKPLPTPVFRSYHPNDESLQGLKRPKILPESVEDSVSHLLEEAKKTEMPQEIDLAELAPRKVDWDLKRNIQKKLDKLEKRTQRAIAELIRDRMKDAIRQAQEAERDN